MDTNSSHFDGDRPVSRVGARSRSHSRRLWLLLLGVPLAAGIVSVSVARAHGFGGGPHGEGGGFMQIHERIDHLLGAAGASDGQKTQIKAIWEGLRPQLKPLHKQHQDIRRQMGEAMAGATIDPTRVEQLRRQSVQTMDKISALMTQGMVASAQVLTPAQRQIVLTQVEEHRRHRDGAELEGPRR
jgi:periplasmic protein CpxP/Spy